MRQTTLLACLLSLSLTTGCTLAQTPMTSPQSPSPTGPAASTATPPPADAASPFSRLANPTQDEPLVVADYFADASASLAVTGVTISGGGDDDQDGAPDYRVQGQVDLGTYWGLHDVRIVENDAPGASGQLDRFVVTDTTASSSFTLELTPDNGNGIIQQGETLLTFLFNDDGTVTLNGDTPLSMEEAAQELAQLAAEGEVSPHAVALLYARLVRSPVDTTPPSYHVTSYDRWVLANRALLQTFLLMILELMLSFRLL